MDLRHGAYSRSHPLPPNDLPGISLGRVGWQHRPISRSSAKNQACRCEGRLLAGGSLRVTFHEEGFFVPLGMTLVAGHQSLGSHESSVTTLVAFHASKDPYYRRTHGPRSEERRV